MYPTLTYTESTCAVLQHEVDALYQGENLMVPQLAADLPPLRRIGPTAFATQRLPGRTTVYDVIPLLDGLTAGDIATPFAAFGLAGHGLTSQAVHYHFATSQVVVLLQMRWGTVVNDPEAARTRYGIYLGWCKRLERESRAAMVRGTFPEGQRIVVLHSDFVGRRWAWVPVGYDPEHNEAPEWQLDALDPIFAVAQHVRFMIR